MNRVAVNEHVATVVEAADATIAAAGAVETKDSRAADKAAANEASAAATEVADVAAIAIKAAEKDVLKRAANGRGRELTNVGSVANDLTKGANAVSGGTRDLTSASEPMTITESATS